MVCRYYGHDENPTTLNDKLKALGSAGYISGGNYVPGALPKVFSDIKETTILTPSRITDEQLSQIKNAIDSGWPVMVKLDYNPQTVALDQHFVLLVDYDASDENNFTIADPLGGKIQSLKVYLGWYRPDMRTTVEKYVIFQGKVPTGSGTIAVPKDIYPNIIHGSTEWDKTTTAYIPDTEPKNSTFEQLQRVVNGYKSDATAAKNELSKTQTDLKIALTEVTNQQDKLANTLIERQRTYDLLLGEYNALKTTSGNIDELRSQYEGTLTAVKTDLREAQKLAGQRATEIATLQEQLRQAQSGVETLSALDKLINYVKSIWAKQ
jgi:hypothetical protein